MILKFCLYVCLSALYFHCLWGRGEGARCDNVLSAVSLNPRRREERRLVCNESWTFQWFSYLHRLLISVDCSWGEAVAVQTRLPLRLLWSHLVVKIKFQFFHHFFSQETGMELREGKCPFSVIRKRVLFMYYLTQRLKKTILLTLALHLHQCYLIVKN